MNKPKPVELLDVDTEFLIETFHPTASVREEDPNKLDDHTYQGYLGDGVYATKPYGTGSTELI